MSQKSHQRNDQFIVKREEDRAWWLHQEHQLLAQITQLGFIDITTTAEFAHIAMPPFKGQMYAENFLVLQHMVKQHVELQTQLWVEDSVTHELNKVHAIVHEGHTYVMTEKPNEVFGGLDFTLESKQSLYNMYENKRVEDDSGKLRSKADIWFKSPLRREYNKIVFDPNTTPEKCYNLWHGFAIKPCQSAASLRYWMHVYDVICGANKERYEFVRKWLAYVFQKPDVVHTALVLCGSQGVGKNSFVEPLGKLMGQHFVQLSNIHELISNFNDHLKFSVLIHANEALWGGNKKEIGTLKSMITEYLCLIEGKGKDRIMVRNFKHAIFSSNEAWPVHLDPDDRRFFVLYISDAHKEDHEWFAALDHQLKNEGGYEALLYDLLNEDISNFNPRRLPANPEAFDIKMRSAESTDRFIYNVLQDGYFADAATQVTHYWGDIPKDLMYEFYTGWCTYNGEMRVSKDLFCKRVKRLLPSTITQRANDKGKRINIFRMPNQASARDEFSFLYKAGNEIWLPDELGQTGQSWDNFGDCENSDLHE